MLKPEVKEKWVSALRSGDFKQGKTRLRDKNDEYCCLGVLCEVAARSGAVPPAALCRGGGSFEYGAETAYLPPSVARWAEATLGKLPPNPVVRVNEEYQSLVHLNDLANLDFSEIADLIEEQL